MGLAHYRSIAREPTLMCDSLQSKLAFYIVELTEVRLIPKGLFPLLPRVITRLTNKVIRYPWQALSHCLGWLKGGSLVHSTMLYRVSEQAID